MKIMRLIVVTLGILLVFVSNAGDDSKIEQLMKQCVLPEVTITKEMTLLSAFQYFRHNTQMNDLLSTNGIPLKMSLSRDGWQIGSNGKKISPQVVPYSAKDVTFHYALKSVCLLNGYKFYIEDGVIRIVRNTIKQEVPRLWTARNGTKILARWVGMLSTGDGIVLNKEDDIMNLFVAYFSNLSEADRKVVERVGACDFKPYYYIYGDKNNLKTDNVICSLKEAMVEQNFIDQAFSLMVEKSSFTTIRYEIFQSLPKGALCRLKRRYRDGTWEEGYQGELFFIPGGGVTADNEAYLTDHFYWLGTYSYETTSGEVRTVNAYSSCDVFEAVETVRRTQKFYLPNDRRFVPGHEGGRSQRDTTSGREKTIVGSGSGVIITKDGYIITNAHVIKNAKKIDVVTSQGTVEGVIVKVDVSNDLALLKIRGTYKPISFSRKRKESLGASVFTIGFPRPGLQGFSPKVTKGVVSGLEGYRGDVKCYQIDASIQPGNSGGLLANSSGELVGVCSSSLVYAGEDSPLPQNVNYAIKKSYVMSLIDSVETCAESVVEGDGKERSLEEAIAMVKNSCVLILVYE